MPNNRPDPLNGPNPSGPTADKPTTTGGVPTSSVLEITDAPTGDAVWDQTMIKLKREGVNDVDVDDQLPGAEAVRAARNSQNVSRTPPPPPPIEPIAAIVDASLVQSGEDSSGGVAIQEAQVVSQQKQFCIPESTGGKIFCLAVLFLVLAAGVSTIGIFCGYGGCGGGNDSNDDTSAPMTPGPTFIISTATPSSDPNFQQGEDPPGTPVSATVDNLEMTLKGLNHLMSPDAFLAWKAATEEHTQTYFIQNQEWEITNLEITVKAPFIQKIIPPSRRRRRRRRELFQTASVEVTYSQLVSYATQDETRDTPAAVVKAPFLTHASQDAYVEALKDANNEFEAVTGVSEVVVAERSGNNNESTVNPETPSDGLSKGSIVGIVVACVTGCVVGVWLRSTCGYIAQQSFDEPPLTLPPAGPGAEYIEGNSTRNSRRRMQFNEDDNYGGFSLFGNTTYGYLRNDLHLQYG